MIRRFITSRFGRPSEPEPTPLPDTPRKGIPRYARYRHRATGQPPEYDNTAEFLDLNPLADIPIGTLARPEGSELEAPEWGVDDWLDGQYEPFPWRPEDEGTIINEENFA